MVKKAFTVLEILTVLIIISVLASFILPQFGLSKKSAQVSKARSDISAIRMGILLNKNKKLIQGEDAFVDALDNSTVQASNEPLFGNENILAYPIISVYGEDIKSYSWSKIDTHKYRLWLDISKYTNNFVDFIYDPEKGTFGCDYPYEGCVNLTQ